MSTSTDATGTGTPTLEDISTQITNLAEQIRTIKQSSTPDKEALKSHITQLQTLKKDYASLNNGIGIDGLPFVEPLSKAEKKKKEKEEKRRKLEEEEQKGGGKQEEVDGGEKVSVGVVIIIIIIMITQVCVSCSKCPMNIFVIFRLIQREYCHK